MVDKVNKRNSCSFKKTCTCTTFIWHDIDIKSIYTVTKRKKPRFLYNYTIKTWLFVHLNHFYWLTQLHVQKPTKILQTTTKGAQLQQLD